jgi:hypothetical protein
LANCSMPKSDMAHGKLSVDLVNSRMGSLHLARHHSACRGLTL